MQPNTVTIPTSAINVIAIIVILFSTLNLL
jgi:hypothetical protein